MAPPTLSMATLYDQDRSYTLVDRNVYVSPLYSPLPSLPTSPCLNSDKVSALRTMTTHMFVNPEYFYLLLVPAAPDYNQEPLQPLDLLVLPIRKKEELIGEKKKRFWSLEDSVAQAWRILEASLRRLWMFLDEFLKKEMGEPPVSMKSWPWPSQYGYDRRYPTFNKALEAAENGRDAFLPLLALVAFYVVRAEKTNPWDWRSQAIRAQAVHPIFVDAISRSSFCSRYTKRIGGSVNASIWLPDHIPLLEFIEGNFSADIHVYWGALRNIEETGEGLKKVDGRPTVKKLSDPGRQFYVRAGILRQLVKWDANSRQPRAPAPRPGRVTIPGDQYVEAPTRPVYQSLLPAVAEPRWDVSSQDKFDALFAETDSGPDKEMEVETEVDLRDVHVVEKFANQKPGETFAMFMARRKEVNARKAEKESEKDRQSRLSREAYAAKHHQASKRGGQKIYQWRPDGKGNETRHYISRAQLGEDWDLRPEFVHYDGFSNEWDIYIPHTIKDPRHHRSTYEDEYSDDDDEDDYNMVPPTDEQIDILPPQPVDNSLVGQATRLLDRLPMPDAIIQSPTVTNEDLRVPVAEALKVAKEMYGYVDDPTFDVPRPLSEEEKKAIAAEAKKTGENNVNIALQVRRTPEVLGLKVIVGIPEGDKLLERLHSFFSRSFSLMFPLYAPLQKRRHFSYRFVQAGDVHYLLSIYGL